MLSAIPFPAIGPDLFRIDAFELFGFTLGPFAIRWYALAYIVGLIVGWRYCVWLAKKPPALVTRLQLDDFLVWATIGVILGGRLGYVLFYQPSEYLAHPQAILQLWRGGMSFHGGCTGVVLALVLFSRRHRIPLLALADIVAAATPIGLFLGRLANFVNAELYGRPTDVPWAMVFPTDPQQLPRHPSQLYEAGLEGIVLFAVLFALGRRESIRRQHGLLTGAFLTGYALSRILGEFFREPDAFLGFLFAGATMGQLLSLPMLALGGFLIWYARRGRAQPAK
jgi:phosphatidylglycerol:prolipoprotein diacylglycerol transferase